MEIFKLFGSIYVDNDKANKSIAKTGEEAQKSGGLLSGLGSVAKKVGGILVGAFAVQKAVQFATSVARVGIEYNALQQQSEVTWTTLLGSQEQAIAQLERIEQFAAKTPFSKMGVDQMAKYLHNAGYEGDAVFDTLTKIGDMGSAFGLQEDSLVELTRQFSQVQQAGYAYTEDLNILADRGIPIYQAIADEVGVTVAEVKKMASDGKLTADIYNAAIDSMAESTAGAMDAQSQTFNGMISTLQDNLTSLAGLLTEKLFNGLSGVLGIILPMVEGFVSAYKETGSLSQAFGALIPEIEALGVNLDGLKSAWDVMSSFLNDTYQTMIAPLIDGFREMFDDASQKFSENSINIQQTFSFVGQVLSDIWYSVIQPVWELFMDYIFMVWDFFNENITNVLRLWNIVAEAIKMAWETILRPVFDVLMDWVRQIFDKFNVYMPEIQRVVDEVFMMIKAAWETALKPAFQAISSFLQTVLLPVFNAVFKYGILPIVDTVFHTIISLWDKSLKPIFQGITDFIGGIFTGNWERAWNGVSNIFSGIWNGLKTVAKAPLNAIISMVNSVIGGLNKLKLPDWVPGIGGKGINIPTIPMLYKGTDYFTPTKTWGNMALVGEQGPEIVELPTGSKVNTADETRDLLSGNGGGVFIFQSILDGQVVAETTAQYSDIINGSRLSMTERGLIL